MGISRLTCSAGERRALKGDISILNAVKTATSLMHPNSFTLLRKGQPMGQMGLDLSRSDAFEVKPHTGRGVFGIMGRRRDIL
jgi:hypothetical protein